MKLRDKEYVTMVIQKFPGKIYYDILSIEATYCRMGVSRYISLLIEVLVSKPELISTVRKEIRALFNHKYDERELLKTQTSDNPKK